MEIRIVILGRIVGRILEDWYVVLRMEQNPVVFLYAIRRNPMGSGEESDRFRCDLEVGSNLLGIFQKQLVLHIPTKAHIVIFLNL